MSSLDLLSDLVNAAKQQGADEVKVANIQSASLQVRMRLGKLEKLEREESCALGLTVYIGKRKASVSSSDLSKQGLDELVTRVMQMVRIVPEDPYTGLASRPTKLQKPSKIWIFMIPTSHRQRSLIEQATLMEQEALSVKRDY